jgi:tungstate transport system substrate-binding protein
VIAVVLAAAMACAPAPRRLDLATTTSVVNSGLLDHLLPHYTAQTVRVHAAGSGRALKMLEDGAVDAVISHAPAAEAETLARHPDWFYQKLAYNRFVIAGPRADPAGIRGAATAVEAFQRIAAGEASFVSRGDGSGTHERELELWKRAGTQPGGGRLLVSGKGMALALRHANESDGYVLTDEATWWQFEDDLSNLAVLFSDDPLLLNTYAVVYPTANTAASALAAWLLDGEGRARIDAYRVAGKPAFTVWPIECPSRSPAALPSCSN